MLCTQPDSYINDRYESEPRWIIRLSNGDMVYQDDDRPGIYPNSAWIRLRNFLQENPEIFIVGMTIGFRDNIVNVGDNAEGYFFVKSAFGTPSDTRTIGMWVVGTYNDNQLHTKRYIVPEMVLVEEEIRDPIKAGECFICQPSVMKNILSNHQPHPTSIVRPLNILPN